MVLKNSSCLTQNCGDTFPVWGLSTKLTLCVWFGHGPKICQVWLYYATSAGSSGPITPCPACRWGNQMSGSASVWGVQSPPRTIRWERCQNPCVEWNCICHWPFVVHTATGGPRASSSTCRGHVVSLSLSAPEGHRSSSPQYHFGSVH